MAKRVLIIDDDNDYVEAVSMLLEAKGYEVLSAPDGKAGFAKAKEDCPGLIILDVMMATRTEGFDVARLLKDDAKTKDIPVILITGIKRDMNLAFGFEPDEVWLPVKAVLDKPVKPEVLLKAVEENIKPS
ncbi:MAG TPA: response regulator [Candidatus Omnitrophota bacterium]|nr:response regulator [Candidatus Omnitrophota bacterium]